MTRQPSIFVSHGSPTLVMDNVPAHHFLKEMLTGQPRPDAIVMISAHHMGHGPEVARSEAPPMIYDFGGFQRELYKMQYPAPGDTGLSERIYMMLSDAGFEPSLRDERGFDHGAWVPLKLALPDADIPVVQVSVSLKRDADWHFRLGRALAPLRDDNIMIMGSGSLTHNLHEVFGGGMNEDAPRQNWADDFTNFIADAAKAGDLDAITHAVSRAPYGQKNHPTPEHYWPLVVAAGAGGETPKITRLHHSYTFGILAMDAYRFD